MTTLAMHWHISLLGGLQAEQKQQTLTRFRTQKTGALLAYLAFFPDRLHPRDVLADLFWPDDAPEDARASLRTALNSLRKQLEPPGAPAQSVLITDRSWVHLRSEAITTDVGLFRAALEAAQQTTADPHTSAGHLDRAVRAYQGELLPGFYEEWVLQGRRHLAEAYAGALRQLLAYAEKVGDLNQALDYAFRILAIDPVSEEAHVDVMRLFRNAGRPKEALLQYDSLVHVLREQLNIEPAEESRNMAAALRETLVRSVTVRVEWSYRLLSPEQQVLFRRLSVFRGGWNLAAAYAICAETPSKSETRLEQEDSLLRDLTLLAESSLIFTEEVTLERGPEIRFMMLETLRDYGEELLSAEEKHRLMERHAEYFFDLVDAYGQEFLVKNRDRLAPDLDNLRTALRRFADDPSQGERTLQYRDRFSCSRALCGSQAAA